MRNKSSKDKGNSKTAHPQMQSNNTVKSEGPPVKIIQPTAEQMLLCKLINTEHVDESKLQKDVKQIMDLTGCEQRTAETALHDTCDIERAVNSVLEGKTDESEWRESGKKKKKPKMESASPAAEEMMPVVESKPEKRDTKEQNDKDNGQRTTKDEKENDRNFREQSDNFRRSRRNDNRPPRLSRGRGMPDRNVDRPDGDVDNAEKDLDNRERSDRWYDRGRGRGRGNGQRRGRGNFRSNRGGFDKSPSHFVNGPQIGTWTNETAVIEQEPKISNWSECKEDWGEDVDTWTGQLAETKVFTSSVASAVPEHNETVQLETSTLSNTFDLSALYNKHQSDLSAKASYISQYNQQATESIKNSIGIGSGSSSSLQKSITSQTASNVGVLVSLQRNTLHDLSELTGTGLTSSGLSGNNLVSNSLSVTSRTVSSMTEPSTSLGASDLNSFGGTSFAGTKVSGSLAGLSAVSQSAIMHSNPGLISASSAASQMLQQKSRAPAKTKLPPPSKIPASAVEMPGNIMTSLDVEFGADSAAPFSFGGNESVSYSSSVDAKSTSAINQIVQGPLNNTNEVMRNTALEQSSRYQQSPYATPTKQITVENSSQMAGSKDVKSPQHISEQSSQSTHYYDDNIHQESTQQSTKIGSGIGSYVPSSSYQSAGYTSHNTAEYQPSGKPGSYPNNQYKPGNQTTTNSNQYSSHQYTVRQPSPTQGDGTNQHYGGSNQFATGSQYQSPPSGYQSSQTDYQSSQSPYQQPSQAQYQPNQTQFQNFQAGTTFQNQLNYSTSQSSQNSYYPSTTSNSYSSQSQPNSVYSQSSRPNSYLNQSFLNPNIAACTVSSTFQTVVTQATSVNVAVPAAAKSRDIQSDNSYSRDTRSATRFTDNSSMTYNRDESVSNSHPRESGVSYNKRDSMSSSGSYPRDTPSGDSTSVSYDSHLASASFNGRDSQTAPSGFRDGQSGAVYGTQTGSYQGDTGQSHTQTGYNTKSFRNSAVSTLPSVLTNSILVDSFSKIAVKDGSAESRQSTSSQFEATTKVTTNSTALTSATAVTTSPPTGMTVTSSTITKVSTSTTLSAPSTKAPLNLPPGVPLIPQQYIMGQAGSLPFYGLQRPMYNMEEFQFLQQRLTPYATNTMYDLTGATAAAGLQIPPTTLMSNTGNNQTAVPYSGATDVSKLTRVDAQSPTGAMPNSQPPAAGQTTAHQQPYILNYSYYYPPSLLPAAGYQYPMLPDHGPYVTSSSMIFQMPQVTNAAHAGAAASTQYLQKGYGSHVQYGTNKVYDDLANPNAGDFSKGPYGTSQTQSKANGNTSVTSGTGTSDIQMSGYGKTHAQVFEKHGFPAGTPPFNLQMATAQLASGTQTVPLGAPTAAYGTPFLPMIAPHSQVMHHPIQDTSLSTRGSQPASVHGQSRTNTKPYGTTNWVSY